MESVALAAVAAEKAPVAAPCPSGGVAAKSVRVREFRAVAVILEVPAAVIDLCIRKNHCQGVL